MTHLTETEAEKVGADAADAIPQHIVDAAKKVVVDDLGIDTPGNLQEVYIDVIADAIFDAVLAERERSRWQSMDTAPMAGRFLASAVGREVVTLEYNANYELFFTAGKVTRPHFQPTHWMPLPAGPKAEG